MGERVTSETAADSGRAADRLVRALALTTFLQWFGPAPSCPCSRSSSASGGVRRRGRGGDGRLLRGRRAGSVPAGWLADRWDADRC